MKVSELIEKLQALPPETDVVIDTEGAEYDVHLVDITRVCFVSKEETNTRDLVYVELDDKCKSRTFAKALQNQLTLNSALEKKLQINKMFCNEMEKVAHEWMREYQKLKDKYEPETFVTSEAGEDTSTDE